jgi:two-component system nitrogen regulation response regulator NtrX
VNEVPVIQILIIDDEKNVRRSISVILEDAGYAVSVAEDAIRGMEKMRAQAQSTAFDIIILDIRLGDVSGIQLFQKIRAEGFTTPVLFISGNASLSEAVETIRLGGADFLEKPFAPDRLLLSVERVLRMGDLERQIYQLKSSGHSLKNQGGMIGESASMKALWTMIQKVAPTRSKVLFSGDSGTGKELIARAIHQLSTVAKGPFLKVNCAAIPSELIESELFGHERGSFTGATQMKRGFFELANHGTIFLDEIAEMSASAQAKVLRVLQSQEFTRVGGSQVIRVEVRVIAASHKELADEVKAGNFREDLFFRLNVVPIKSIPLREKSEDIPLLFSSYLQEFCDENGFAIKEVTSEALLALMRYSWPGNIRELRNLAERLVIFSGPKIDVSDLPEELRNEKREQASHFDESSFEMDTTPLSLEQFKKKTERQYIVSALRKTQGHISRAANLLDLERTYLHRKIQDHAIKKGEYFS